jgi:hypothetical protein
MQALTDRVSTFVRACEAIHWLLIEGHSLTIEERDIIQQTAVQLLMRVEENTYPPNQPPIPSSNMEWKKWDEQLAQEPHP